jgi:hypothetical protein
MMYSRFAAKSNYRHPVYAISERQTPNAERQTPNAKRQTGLLHPELELEFPAVPLAQPIVTEGNKQDETPVDNGGLLDKLLGKASPAPTWQPSLKTTKAAVLTG